MISPRRFRRAARRAASRIARPRRRDAHRRLSRRANASLTSRARRGVSTRVRARGIAIALAPTRYGRSTARVGVAARRAPGRRAPRIDGAKNLPLKSTARARDHASRDARRARAISARRRRAAAPSLDRARDDDDDATYATLAHARRASAAYAAPLPGGRQRARTYPSVARPGRRARRRDDAAAATHRRDRRGAMATTARARRRAARRARCVAALACACVAAAACAYAASARDASSLFDGVARRRRGKTTTRDDDDDDATREDEGEGDGKARARSLVWTRRALSVLVPLRGVARRWLGLGASERASGAFVDPSLPIYVVGATSCRALERRLGKELWVWFVDAIGIGRASAGRARLTSVLRDARTTEALDETFDELAKRYPQRGDDDDGDDESDERAVSLSAEGLIKFSDGIRGSIRHVMAVRPEAVAIQPASASEHAFLRDNFDLLFPSSDPLDRSTFHALAKLILVRRIVKALVKDFGGVERIRCGLSEPLVIDVQVVVEGDVVFRVHTVAPKSDAVSGVGQRLGVISE